MCFVHSDDSTPIQLTLQGGALHAKGHKGRAQKRLYWKLLWEFARQLPRLRLLPLPFIGGLALPGSSVHHGGSVPIGGQGALSCDTNGQLKDHPGIYVADAASLPDIPAGSYTLSIMANAHRIGRAAATPSA
jgi:choline dehydrogenase-like flavoprotein